LGDLVATWEHDSRHGMSRASEAHDGARALENL
jgi:hypothetical protein